MLSSGFVVALLSLAAPGDVEARPLAGPAIVGRLTAVDSGGFAIATPDGEQRLALDQTLSVRRRGTVPTPETAPIDVTLVDGTVLHSRDLAVTDGDAEIRLIGGSTFETLVRSIALVRFGSLSATPDLEKRWEEIVAAERAGDLIVVRKVTKVPGDDGTEREVASLDYFEGVLGAVDADSIAFTISGKTIDVKRDRIVGVGWYRPAGRELPETLCTVETATGDRWAARSLESKGDSLTISLVSGAKRELPLAEATTFDFSGGKIVYLSDLKPDSIGYVPSIELETRTWRDNDAGFFRFRTERSILKPEIRLFGESYAKGIVASSKTEIAYRLPARFRRLQATVGVDDSSRAAKSRVRLVVEADGQILFDGEFSGQDAEPMRLDLAIVGVRRLKFTIDYADKLSLGDHLALADLRVLE